jgi:hypothetical protein
MVGGTGCCGPFSSRRDHDARGAAFDPRPGSPSAPEISARIGAATFLPKPCEPRELVEAIHRIVGEIRPVHAFEDEPTGSTRQYS